MAGAQAARPDDTLPLVHALQQKAIYSLARQRRFGYPPLDVPRGELAAHTLAIPAQTNPARDIFGIVAAPSLCRNRTGDRQFAARLPDIVVLDLRGLDDAGHAGILCELDYGLALSASGGPVRVSVPATLWPR